MGFRPSLALFLGSLALLGSQPLLAQPTIDPAGQRAANLARNTGIQLNGGLTKYRPAACMFVIGGGKCLVKTDAKGFLFRFEGGGPAWQDLKQPATTLTEVLIDPSGRQVVGTPINKLLSPATKP
ncbi:MAG: hypothetical protein ACOYLI_11700 [Synechococcus lacustris]|jgi:hypothetical protein